MSVKAELVPWWLGPAPIILAALVVAAAFVGSRLRRDLPRREPADMQDEDETPFTTPKMDKRTWP